MDFQHILYRCKAINKYQCERALCSHRHIVFLCTIDKAWELLLQCSSKSYGVERAHRTFAISLTQIRDAFYVIEIYPSKKKSLLVYITLEECLPKTWKELHQTKAPKCLRKRRRGTTQISVSKRHPQTPKTLWFYRYPQVTAVLTRTTVIFCLFSHHHLESRRHITVFLEVFGIRTVLYHVWQALGFAHCGFWHYRSHAAKLWTSATGWARIPARDPYAFGKILPKLERHNHDECC